MFHLAGRENGARHAPGMRPKDMKRTTGLFDSFPIDEDHFAPRSECIVIGAKARANPYVFNAGNAAFSVTSSTGKPIEATMPECPSARFLSVTSPP